jgi:hypothetical protein
LGTIAVVSLLHPVVASSVMLIGGLGLIADLRVGLFAPPVFVFLMFIGTEHALGSAPRIPQLERVRTGREAVKPAAMRVAGSDRRI